MNSPNQSPHLRHRVMKQLILWRLRALGRKPLLILSILATLIRLEPLGAEPCHRIKPQNSVARTVISTGLDSANNATVTSRNPPISEDIATLAGNLFSEILVGLRYGAHEPPLSNEVSDLGMQYRGTLILETPRRASQAEKKPAFLFSSQLSEPGKSGKSSELSESSESSEPGEPGELSESSLAEADIDGEPVGRPIKLGVRRLSTNTHPIFELIAKLHGSLLRGSELKEVQNQMDLHLQGHADKPQGGDNLLSNWLKLEKEIVDTLQNLTELVIQHRALSTIQVPIRPTRNGVSQPIYTDFGTKYGSGIKLVNESILDWLDEFTGTVARFESRFEDPKGNGNLVFVNRFSFGVSSVVTSAMDLFTGRISQKNQLNNASGNQGRKSDLRNMAPEFLQIEPAYMHDAEIAAAVFLTSHKTEKLENLSARAKNAAVEKAIEQFLSNSGNTDPYIFRHRVRALNKLLNPKHQDSPFFSGSIGKKASPIPFLTRFHRKSQDQKILQQQFDEFVANVASSILALGAQMNLSDQIIASLVREFTSFSDGP